MKLLALIPVSLLVLAMPATAADLDGPTTYRERDVVIERPAPPRVIERERIIEHHYAPPIVEERQVYVEPRVYEPREYVYVDRPYGYAYTSWRPRHFFPRYGYWHRHHHGW